MQRLLLLILAALGLLLLTWWCVRGHAEEIEKDLSTRAAASIAQLEGASGVKITADGRDLTLEGEISPNADLRAEIVRSTKVRGVRVLSDQLSDLSTPRFSAAKIDDRWRITGLVDSNGRRRVEEKANLWLGEGSQVELTSLAPAGDSEPAAAERVFVASLGVLGGVDNPQITVTPERAVVRGQATSGGEVGHIYRQLAEAAAGELELDVDLGGHFTAADLSLEARGTEDRLIVSGILPEGDLKTRLMNAASSGSTRTLEDRLLEVEVSAADGEPSEINAADAQDAITVDVQSFGAGFEAALPMLAELKNPRLVERPGELELSGNTEDPDQDKKFREALANAVPGYRVAVDTAPALEASSCQGELDRLLGEEKIFFASNSHTIEEKSTGLLNRLASTLRRCPGLGLRVEGHTDSDGDDAFNLALSRRRSSAVTSKLAALGVLSNRLVAEGFGESRPISDNTTAAGKAANRRIEFLLQEGP